MGRPVVYFEIGCRDRAAGTAFYRDLFGWEVTEGTLSSALATGEGGIDGHLAALGHEPHTYTIFYVDVADLDVAIERAVTLGGELLVGPAPIADGRFAWIADPQGNTVGLIEPTGT
jgi:uncharacterized protein